MTFRITAGSSFNVSRVASKLTAVIAYKDCTQSTCMESTLPDRPTSMCDRSRTLPVRDDIGGTPRTVHIWQSTAVVFDIFELINDAEIPA